MLPLDFSLNICCFDNDTSLCGSVWIYLIWDPMFLLPLAICFHLQYWNVFTHNFISYIFDAFLLSPSETPILWVLVRLILFNI